MKLLVGALALAAIILALFGTKTPPEPPPIWKDPSFRNALVKGITVVAPASGLKEDALPKAREIAEHLGLRLPEGAVKPGVVPYNANDDETRFNLFRQALHDPDAEVLWALRGGYGSGRLLSSFAGMPRPEKAKVFIGYSDMTFLHLLLNSWGWRTVHGAMFWELDSRSKNEENFRQLAALLAGELKELEYPNLQPLNQPAKDAAYPIEGVLSGGNLTCLAAAAGTPWALRGKGKIVFIEEVGEKGYRVDRLFTQLRDSGALENAAAVLLGEFTEGDDATEFAIKRFADHFPAPVFQSSLFGHGRDNRPLLFGGPAGITHGADKSDTATLRIAAGTLP